MEFIVKRRRRSRRLAVREEEKHCSWADLDRDVLILIYDKLGFKDLIVGAPLCCTSWYTASKDPSLWRQIDLNAFSSHINTPVESRKLIEFVVDRSVGSLTSINFSLMAQEDDLLYVAERCPGLKHFSLRPGPKQMDEEKIFLAIGKLSQLESMAIDEDIIKPTFDLLYTNRECKFLATDEELYGIKNRLFKFEWKLIYLIRECKSLISRARAMRERIALEGLLVG